MRLFDAHCHLDLPELDAEREAMLARAHEAGVERILVPGYHPSQWPVLGPFRAERAGVDVAVGIHPWEIDTLSDEELRAALDAMPRAALDAGAVAIGEFGLDRNHTRDPARIARQVEVFRAHLGVARRLGLPIVLHVVDAHGLVLELLESMAPLPGGMMHSYSGSAELVARYVALGLFVSFSGPVTWPRAKKTRRAALACPLERLLIETDAPDLPPEGTRKPNEPARLVAIARAVAELHGVPVERVAEATFANAAGLFGTAAR